MDERRYIYGIVGDAKETKWGSPAIGGHGNEVYRIAYRDIAAVVSASPVMKYPISRQNTMAHQKVLEELMESCTVLPVRFGTVARGRKGMSADERISKEVLEARYDELQELLIKMDHKIELGIKALWTDMKVIFEEIVAENSRIKKLRQRILAAPVTQPFGEKATLGELVKDALERKKAKEEKDIVDAFKKIYVDSRRNKVFGDNMITNSAFLVDKSRAEEFDGLVNQLAASCDGRTKLKYIGPVPPINFVELVIILEGDEA